MAPKNWSCTNMETESSDCTDSGKLEYLKNNFHVTLFIKEAGKYIYNITI